MSFSIDFVVPWVDGTDPAWQEEYSKYSPASGSDNSSARYREWGLFKYWFRAIEDYAPWVRKIHLLTYGHLPSWLDVSHPKINLVNHKEFIPEEYLPTFSSHTIELNMHRIPGLSDNFVYFNDDVYLTSPTDPEDFFREGKPLDSGVFGIIKNTDRANFMPYIMLNMLAEINMNFSKRKMLRDNPLKWFSPLYGRYLLINLYLLAWPSYTGFRNFHGATAFNKETFSKVWASSKGVLEETCQRKFRDKADVNQYLMRYWQLCEGNFIPARPSSSYITIGNKKMEEIEKILYDKRYRMVCINDDPMGFDFESEREKLAGLLADKYRRPSSFELVSDENRL